MGVSEEWDEQLLANGGGIVARIGNFDHEGTRSIEGVSEGGEPRKRWRKYVFPRPRAKFLHIS